MGGTLEDGTTLPTYLRPGPAPARGAAVSMGDYSLRIGEVILAIPPNDPTNETKTQWVYLVRVFMKASPTAPYSYAPYRCVVSDLFGGMADHFRYSVRSSEGEPTSEENLLGLGTQVLILCANGDKSNALIVGGGRHTRDLKPDPSTTFMDFLFNGVHFTIDADGALKLEVPGATKVDGTPADTRDENNKGPSVTFSKEGNIVVSDGNGDTVTVSSKDKSITVKASKVTVEADEVMVNSGKVSLGGEVLNPLDEVVIGSGIDTFTGVPYKSLGSTSSRVKVKK